ncbi:ATP-binding protein [Thalassoglobus sp. JC818]|uniref:sensor histidine kinase n=1 Tax=Thalassoglobus sp. JC818 TaxID=3232136 RepID=UPI003457D143
MVESDASGSNGRRSFEQQFTEIATLAGGLAHEIRNPLSTIQMNLELLFEDLEVSDTPQSKRTLKRLRTIQGQCENLEGILESFLQFARAGQLHLEEAKLNDVVTKFLEFYQAEADEHQIDVRPHLRANLPPVCLDTRLFNQVLTNLVKNAQQAMPEGGALEFQTSCEGDSVVLDIIDTGVGISKEACDKVFDIFFSTKPSGNGLGLPTARKIIEAHGGAIRCESEPGRGTKFRLTLPAAESNDVPS